MLPSERGTDNKMSVATEPRISLPASTDTSVPARVLGLVRSASAQPLAHIAGTVAICTFAALLFIRNFSITDPDIWWHLATGNWILQHHAIPMTDPFSSYGMGKPWIAYSWLFEVLVQLLYMTFGYVGIVLYDVIFRVALATALFHLVRSLLPHFWRAVALTALSIYTMTAVIGPRPGMLTILFCILELDILLSSRRTGETRGLWLLPPIFAIWANWHIQFVYGLLILAVFTGEALLAAVARSKFFGETRLPAMRVSIVLAFSFLATFVNPYGPRVYSIVLQFAHQTKIYGVITELKAMSFREPQHFVALFLVLGAAMAIGWRRDTSLLWPVFISLAAFVAFRSIREVWFLSVVSACAIADNWSPPLAYDRRPLPWRERLLTGIAILAVLVVGYRHYDVSNSWIEIQVDGNFPEVAVRFIEQNHLAGPLYNHFNDGGYLIWRLPSLPVSMDGRANVHGDERIAHHYAVWIGKPEWASDSELSHANIVLARREVPLASLLRLDSRFRIVFEDVQAVVFQHN
jgi:hypothetical protein